MVILHYVLRAVYVLIVKIIREMEGSIHVTLVIHLFLGILLMEEHVGVSFPISDNFSKQMLK